MSFTKDTESNNGTIEITNQDLNKKVKSFRRIAPQILAAMLKNLLILDYGFSLSIITIILPALRSNDPVKITEFGISWLGSTPYLFKFAGCICSGYIAEHFGRKISLFLVNIPYAIAWFTLWNSTTLWEIFFGNCVLGLAVGLMKTPTMSYISESCETSVRGVLSAIDGFTGTFGSFLILELALHFEWRFISLLCLAVPILTIIGVIFLPESPIWLMSRQRDEQAIKSLQWLRGWVRREMIEEEFKTMKHYQEFSSACSECQKIAQKCTHPAPTFWENIQELKRKRTLKAGIIILVSYALSQLAGMMHLLPFAVQIIDAYNPPMSGKSGAVILSIASIIATVILISTVKLFGKRKIYLFSLVGAVIGHAALSAYGFMVLPNGITSYNSKTMITNETPQSYIPIGIFIFLRFCTSNINIIPMLLFGELFPFKTRSFATGVTTAIYYIIVFISNKTFANIENWVSLPGAFAIYGSIGIVGAIVTYYILPETEKRSNHDIEIHFADNNKRLTDRKIPRSYSSSQVKGSSIADVKTTEFDEKTEKLEK